MLTYSGYLADAVRVASCRFDRVRRTPFTNHLLIANTYPITWLRRTLTRPTGAC